MKINHDCIRDILLYLEENLKIEGHVFLPINLKTLQDNLPEYSAEDVFYSVYNLHQIRFIEGRINNVSNMKMLFCEIENYSKSVKNCIMRKKLFKMVVFFSRMNIIKLTEPNTPLNDADHVGSFNFKENIVWENLNSISLL